MKKLLSDSYVASCKQEDTVYHDELLRLDADIVTFYDFDTFGVTRPGPRGTVIVLYVIGTNTVRIGTDSDEEIVASMLRRGYVVTVADFKNAEHTTSPEIDWTLSELIQHVRDGEFCHGDAFGEGHYHNGYVVPSGHDLSVGNVFWELDRHSVVGTLEKIVYIWNHDLRGCKGEYVIPWIHEDGRRKGVQDDFEGNAPVWYADPKGECEDENGIYTRVKYTKATSVTDCVRPDGTPIDLKLYMQIVYPTHPKEPAPVLVQASSSEHLAHGATMPHRPHSFAFAFRGYAVAVYDYAYVPMVRVDHYGYFDGYGWRGWKTGDNMTYSVYTYNMQLTSTAAIRYLRLKGYEGVYSFSDKIGIIGNSKGSEMTHLGDGRLMQTLSLADGYTEESLDEAIQARLAARPPRFYLPHHHAETRYEMRESGYSQDGVDIAEGTLQPWLTYNGCEIPSGVQFVYSCCGAIVWTFDEGYCPMFISSSIGEKETQGYYRQNEIINLCRTYDVPNLWFEAMVGHGFVPDTHHLYPVNPYAAYTRFADYFLLDAPVSVVYSTPVVGTSVPSSTTVAVHFTGVVRREEIARVTLSAPDGTPVPCTLSSKWGDTYWELTPDRLDGATVYTLTVPDDLVGANGKRIASGYTATFTTEDDVARVLDFDEKTLSVHGATVLDLAKEQGSEITLRLRVCSDSANTILLCSAPTPDAVLCTVPVCGAGSYEVTFTVPTSGKVYLFAKREAGTYPVAIEGHTALETIASAYGGCTTVEGKDAYGVRIGKREFFYGHALYGVEPYLKYRNITGAPLTPDDYGRRFTLSWRMYDESSRQIVAIYNSMSSHETKIIDYRVARRNYTTRKGAFVDAALDFTLYHPMHGEHGLGDKDLIFQIQPTGDPELPVYFTDFALSETVTDVTVATVTLLKG